jgi:uncharacterized caspase-like protein
VVFADACHSGAAAGETPGAKGPAENAVHEYLRQLALARPGRMIFTASARREQSFEKEQLGGGVFTHYLLTGLRGDADADHDGLVTADEIVQYVRSRVPAATEGRQNPGISGLYDKRLPLAVVERK